MITFMNWTLDPRLQAMLIAMGLPVAQVIFVFIGSILLLRLIEAVMRRLRRSVDDGDPSRSTDAEKRVDTLTILTNSTSRVVVWGTAVITVLGILGINITPILTGAGILGVALGFGAQSLVKDLLAGLFVLLEDQYGVGDVIRVDTLAGTVEKINLRTTTLRDINGQVHIIPNGSVARVTVMTKEWSKALVDVRITYLEDTDQVITMIKEIGQAMAQEDPWQGMLLEDLQVLGIEEWTETAVVIRAVVKTLPGKQWDVMRELRRRIKGRFNQAGIVIPFPQTLLPYTPLLSPDERRV